MAKSKDTRTADELLEELTTKLSECNSLVSQLSRQVPGLNVRKLRNDLMFARSKARGLAKEIDELRKPVNAFRARSGKK